MCCTDERTARAAAWRELAARHVSRVSSGAGGGVARVALQVRASAAAPALQLLAYYETGVVARPYRLLRHVFRFTVPVSIHYNKSSRGIEFLHLPIYFACTQTYCIYYTLAQYQNYELANVTTILLFKSKRGKNS